MPHDAAVSWTEGDLPDSQATEVSSLVALKAGFASGSAEGLAQDADGMHCQYLQQSRPHCLAYVGYIPSETFHKGW